MRWVSVLWSRRECWARASCLVSLRLTGGVLNFGDEVVSHTKHVWYSEHGTYH